jgi:hypothetical protein
MADLLATVADLAAALGKPVAEVDATAATVQLEAATAVVQEAAGNQRILEVVGDLLMIPAPSGRWLELPQRPVTAVTSVTLGDGTVVAAGTASGTYRRIQNRLWRNIGWSGRTYPLWPYGLCDDPSEVAVVCTHGWPAGHQQLQRARGAVLNLAKLPFSNPAGVTREQIDDYAVAYEQASAAMDASPYLQKSLRRQYGKRAAMVRVF